MLEQLVKTNGSSGIWRPLVPYHSLCSTCMTYGTLRCAIGFQVHPAQAFIWEAEDFHSVLSMCLLPHTWLYCNQNVLNSI